MFYMTRTNAEFLVGDIATGPYANVPDEAVKTAFVHFLQTSAYPEDFPGIAIGVVPPQDRDFHIIAKQISVDRGRRDGRLIPCNLCGHDKFCNEGMLICDDCGWLYLIGPVCGAKHYENKFRDEVQRYDRQQAIRTATDYLLDIGPSMAEWKKAAESLQPHASAAKMAHDKLKSTPSIFRELRRAIVHQGGWLRVTEKRPYLIANGGQETEMVNIDVARIRGMPAVRTGCRIDSDIADAITTFSKFGQDENGALAAIESADLNGLLPELAKEVRDAISRVCACHDDLHGFAAFFRKENYAAIRRWSEDTRSPLTFGVVANGDTRTLCPRRRSETHRIDVSKLLSAIPKLPAQ